MTDSFVHTSIQQNRDQQNASSVPDICEFITKSGSARKASPIADIELQGRLCNVEPTHLFPVRTGRGTPTAQNFSCPRREEHETPEVLSWCWQLARLKGCSAVHVVQDDSSREMPTSRHQWADKVTTAADAQKLEIARCHNDASLQGICV